MSAPWVEAFQIQDKKFIKESSFDFCRESYKAGYFSALFF